jgi:hypothetical protein
MADDSNTVPIAAIDFLAHEEKPMGLDSVEVQPDGSIVRWTRETVAFTFAFQGATFTAQGKRNSRGLQVVLDASLGPLPFSAQLAMRQAIQALVAAKAATPGPRITIDAAQDIRVSGQFRVPQPISPVAVLTGLTEVLLDLKPWLARLAVLLEGQPRDAVS